MAACDSHEPQQPDSQSMIFSVESGSRAAVMSGDNLTDYPFAVYSDMVSMDGTPESSFITVHDATVVSYSPSERKWAYDNTQYWFSGYQYSFVAYHPAGAPWLSGIRYSKNHLQFTYSQPDDYKDACDVLIATHRRNYTGGKAEAVRFGFAHILTNVNVEMSYNCSSSGPTSITVDDLTFRNIPTKSTYAIKPAPLIGSSMMTSDWENDEGTQAGWTVGERGSLKIVFPSDAPRVVQSNKGDFKLFSESDALLMLPNPLDPDAPAELELNYTTNTGEKETISAVIPKGWSPGTNLTLSLQIANGLVQFRISVEDWKDGSTTDTTVPRK